MAEGAQADAAKQKEEKAEAKVDPKKEQPK